MNRRTFMKQAGASLLTATVVTGTASSYTLRRAMERSFARATLWEFKVGGPALARVRFCSNAVARA
jgi:hypothetical protein